LTNQNLIHVCFVPKLCIINYKPTLNNCPEERRPQFKDFFFRLIVTDIWNGYLGVLTFHQIVILVAIILKERSVRSIGGMTSTGWSCSTGGKCLLLLHFETQITNTMDRDRTLAAGARNQTFAV